MLLLEAQVSLGPMVLPKREQAGGAEQAEQGEGGTPVKLMSINKADNYL